MKILSIGTDRKLFEEGSAVRARQIEYAKKWEEIHIVVFSIKSEIKKTRIQISNNVWVYSTGSLSKLFYILDAIKIGRKILRLGSYVITCQDPFETGLVGWRLAKKFKAPLELQIHTDIGSPYFTSLKLGWRLAFLNFIRLSKGSIWASKFSAYSSMPLLNLEPKTLISMPIITKSIVILLYYYIVEIPTG